MSRSKIICPTCLREAKDVTTFDDPARQGLCSNPDCPVTIFTEQPKQITARAARHSSGKQNWGTPSYLTERAQRFLGGIDLDPASSVEHNKRVGARSIFTEAEDGLMQDWIARSVFCNPPYGRRAIELPKPVKRKGKLITHKQVSSQGLWVAKMIHEYEAGSFSHGLLLVNAEPGSSWYQPLLNYPLLYLNHRIRFIDPDTGEPGTEPTHNSILAYFGKSPVYSFARAFEGVGTVALHLVPEDREEGLTFKAKAGDYHLRFSPSYVPY